ncbi:MAG TPA: baseplate J/gp47 family protein, partial [Caulobacteraceae bacterium]
VTAADDVIWDASSDSKNPIPTPHTQLTLSGFSGWDSATGVTVHFAWSSVAGLLNQPYAAWAGTPSTLLGLGPKPFPAWYDQPIEIQDSTGLGVPATAGSAGDFNVAVASLPDPTPSLDPPFVILPNILPVTRGKTVKNETLGSGDATNPAQDFKLSQSPVTYLQTGSTWSSTIQLTVNGLPWKEVAHFFGQTPDAQVFVTREDNDGATHVMFGDGANGARLPTGANNVVATYRVGGGAASPPAGQLTVIAKPWPGLGKVLNPVAVGGGADPDPPDAIRRYAPRSVLTFGRAVSVFDFEALAAQTPGVTRASAVWAWNDARQRALVTVYVGDTPAAAQAARVALAAAGDPNRPVLVVEATEVPVAMTLTLLIVPGVDADQAAANVLAALTDSETGLFGAWNLGVGQAVFDSQIEAFVLAVQGAVAITAMTFETDAGVDTGPIHNPGEGGYFTLEPADINLVTEPDPNG